MIFRGFFAFFLLLLLGMIYWSTSLLEKDVKSIKMELTSFKSGLNTYHSPPMQWVNNASTPTPSLIDARYPNLLQEDPYYLHTLPALLGPSFQPKGVLKLALVGRPDHLHPFHGFREISRILELCSLRVANLEYGKYETLTSDMALKIEGRPRLDKPELVEYWVHLRSHVSWNPLSPSHFPENFNLSPHFLQPHPVTAHDFKFFLDAIMNPFISEAKAAALRTYYEDIEELRVINPQTFVVRWKGSGSPEKIKYSALSLTASLQPLPSFVYQYFADGTKIIEDDSDPDIYRHHSVWAQNFSHHWAKNVIVSCGPFLFDGMSDEGIRLKRNPHYYKQYAALVEGIQYRFKESVEGIWQDFKAGKIDLCRLAPNQEMEWRQFSKSPLYKEQMQKGMKIQELDYVDLSFSYVGWNFAKPYFADQKVRQAMTLAIDRSRIIEQNLNSLAIEITGPFFCYSPANNPLVTPLPYDPEKAKALLKEAGWEDLNGDGIRDKQINGKLVPFRFTLCYFVKSVTSKIIVDFLSGALREVGIDCQGCGLDLADLSRQFDDKNFDAIFMGWGLGTPPEDPKQLWHSSGAKEKGSSNAIGFANAEIDHIIDQLTYEYEMEKRTALYHRFHTIIHEENPYTFLYTPKVRLLYRERVQNLFIPRERQDLIPGADIPEPILDAVWLK